MIIKFHSDVLQTFGLPVVVELWAEPARHLQLQLVSTLKRLTGVNVFRNRTLFTTALSCKPRPLFHERMMGRRTTLHVSSRKPSHQKCSSRLKTELKEELKPTGSDETRFPQTSGERL